MIITEILARNARMYKDETALIERIPTDNIRREITWKEFDDESNKVANFLIDYGIKKGDKIIHLLVNCLEWLPLYFGILRTGAWVVPLNFRFTSKDIEYCTEISEGKILFFGPEFIERIESAKENLDKFIEKYIYVSDGKTPCPSFAEDYKDLIKNCSTTPPNIELNLTDEAGLYFTSGTTGQPKPILLTHRNLESACIVENRHHLQTHEDNFILIPPLYHTGAKMHWFGNFIVGAKAVILKGVNPKWILEAVSEEGGTIVWLLVPWAQDILTAIEIGDIKLEDYDVSKWRLMHIGAQPVPPSLVRDWLKVFPNHKYDTNYGLSESTGPGCVHLGIENIHKVGAIGIPGFDWEYMIVDTEGNQVEKGAVGELIVKGPGVMKEYYKNPEATENTLKNGWLYTGDMAKIDEDGFIYLVDRKKDVIITGGENIFPVEIEDFLQDHPDIQDAAVIGVPDERLGEISIAIIKLKPNRALTEDDILEFCKKLPRYKQPKKIFFDDVPRNPTGKIEKPKLRKKYAGIESAFKI
jgi:acyl-CoA synthetase (AMP-forming)/AMP-acid ligase II